MDKSHILLYHGVTNFNSVGIENISGKHMEAMEFDKQMKWLSENKNVATLKEINNTPDSVAITFDDGRIVEEKWKGAERWVSYRYQGSVKISTVQVDPKRILALDANLTNNSWTTSPSSSFAARKWSFKWLIWLQNLMEFFVFFS